MQEKDKLEEQANLLRKRKDELETEERIMKRIQEEEEYKVQTAYRKLEEGWDSYGHDDPGLGELLEEERSFLDRFRQENESDLEEIRREAQKCMEETDRELHKVKEELCRMPEGGAEAGRKGEKERWG